MKVLNQNVNIIIIFYLFYYVLFIFAGVIVCAIESVDVDGTINTGHTNSTATTDAGNAGQYFLTLSRS